MTTRQQILVCGSVNGKFMQLLAKINKTNNKSGPYSAVFCVGDFFIKGCESTWSIIKSTGCDIPLYICSPKNGCDFIEEGEIAPNIFYLGKKGILKTSTLKIGYVSGVDEDNVRSLEDECFSVDDIENIKDSCLKIKDFKGIDLLLTYEWPADILKHETKENFPKGEITSSSYKISWLCTQIRPQYIFSGKENIYYARRPYRNYFNEIKGHVSRFVGLSNYNGTKWMCAYYITPIEEIDLSQQIPNIYDCPFSRQLLTFETPPSFKTKDNTNQYFYDTTERNNKRKKEQKDSKNKRGPAFNVDDCWFCLSSPKVEKHLVVTVGDEIYIVLAKGGLTEEHCIILPIGHHYSSLDLPSSAEEELEKCKKSLREFYLSKNMTPIFFERSFKNFHCQIQVIPIPNDIQGIKPIFQDAAESEGFEFLDLPSGVHLKDVIEKKLIETPSGNKEVYPPFFYLEISPELRMVIVINTNKFPLDFGRQTIASEDILNMPDRDSWKSCVLDKDQESKLTLRFRKAFKPFSFVEDDDDDDDNDDSA